MIIKGHIYCVTCLPTGKLYFGQTVKPIEKRWKRHIRDAKKASNNSFHRAIRKYGEENFLVEEVLPVSAPTKEILKKKLDYAEMRLIKRFNTFRNGYNMTLGGEGALGFKLSKESRKKISESRLGELNPNFGRKLSEEHRRNIGLSVRGKYKMTEEHKEKLRKVNSGRFISEETKRKISESKRGVPAWNKGLKCSEEWRRHNSEAQKRLHLQRRNRYEILV